MSIRQIVKLDWAKHSLAFGWVREAGVMLLDAMAILAAIFLALLLYHPGRIAFQNLFGFWVVAVMVLSIKLSVLILMGTNRVILDHLGIEDLIQVFKALSIGSLLFGGMCALILGTGIVLVNLPIIVTDYFFTLVFVGALRASRRVYFQALRRHHTSSLRRVLIAGAGDAGELTLRAMFQQTSPECLPVGLVDDDPAKQGMTIQGIRVLGRRQDIPRLVQKLRVQELLIAMPSAQPSVLRDIAQLGRKAGLKRIKVLPALQRMVNGKVAVSDLRDLQVEDLLGREPVKIDTQEIGKYVRDRVVLVTGGAGSIGSELCRQIATFRPARLIVFDQDETALFQLRQELNVSFLSLNLSVVVGDIQDKDRVRNVFAYFRPKVVFHAAAYKHVSMMEENPEEAIRNNAMGTEIVGKAACFYETEKFVLISTDKAVNPTCVMGATKRLAEKVVQLLNERNSCRFMAVRFGNVLGSRGSVVPIFREQIQRGGPVTVTHPDMRRYFMTPSEAALLVLQAGAIGNGGEIFVLDMGAPVAILDLAREMIQLAGLEPDKDIPIVFTNPYPGEKLFEDILTAEEGTSATKHSRIYMAKNNDVASGERLREALEELIDLTGRGDRRTMIEALCALVPEFCPASSVYDQPSIVQSPVSWSGTRRFQEPLSQGKALQRYSEDRTSNISHHP